MSQCKTFLKTLERINKGIFHLNNNVLDVIRILGQKRKLNFLLEKNPDLKRNIIFCNKNLFLKKAK
jgi:hypothetical protein